MSRHKNILVLGGGRVGSAIARDLSNSPGLTVTVADHSPQALERIGRQANVRLVTVDLQDPAEVRRLASENDLVVGAVPGWMGFNTLRTVLEAERSIVDISFFEEDPFRLNDLPLANGVTAVVDCGVAPGLSNLLLGRSLEEFDEVERFVCYVGGLPQEPVAPWCYQAPYSPPDVIEMYTRPARLRRDGIDLTFLLCRFLLLFRFLLLCRFLLFDY